MKKFTISFLTAFVFSVVSMLGCLSVSAEEQLMTAEISVKEYMELDNSSPSFSEISIEADEEDDYSFYNQLDDNNKAAYDAFSSYWLEPNTSTISYTLPEKVKYEVESLDMSTWTEEQTVEFWGLIFETFQSAEVVFMYDYPEVFWYSRKDTLVSISQSASYSNRKQVYTITVSKVSLTASIKEGLGNTQEAQIQQEFLLDKIAETEINGDDYYTKLKFIHDYIATSVTYNLSAPYADTAYGMFVEPYQVICEGYAEAFKLLCDKEGIPCISIIGNHNISAGTAHMWNYVKMEDGNWYGIDVTWDDLDKDSEPIKYEYFLKGADTFLSGHTPDTTYITPGFVYPELNPTEYVYSSAEPDVTTSVTTDITSITETTTISETTTETTSSSSETTTEASSVSTVSETTATTTESESVTTSVTITTITTTSLITTSATTITTTITSLITTTVSTTETYVTTLQTETTDTQVTVIKGDFNRNGSLDVSDVVALEKLLLKVKMIVSDDYGYELNDDGKLNIWDYVILLRKLDI